MGCCRTSLTRLRWFPAQSSSTRVGSCRVLFSSRYRVHASTATTTQTQAIADGARVVLASRPVSVPAVVVGDTVRASVTLRAAICTGWQLRGPKVIGITGSSGKTSTKDIVGQLLTKLGPTVAPEGSFNTEVGLPLTVLRADAGHQIPGPRIQRAWTRSHRLPLRDRPAADRRRAQRRHCASGRIRQSRRGGAGQG